MNEMTVLNRLLLLLSSDDSSAVIEARRTAADPDYARFHPALAELQAGSGRKEADVLPEEIRSEGKQGLLILCDDPAAAAWLSSAGWPVAGWLHHGNEGVVFSGVPFVLSEISELEPDTYEKVFERLHGLPWTILTTAHCIVREMTTEDLPALYRLYDDPQARRFLESPAADHAEEKERMETYIQKVYGLYGYGYWAVTEKDTGELIGRVGFEPYRAGRSEVAFGYLIRADHRRQGLAMEVCSAVLAFARENLDFPGIGARTRQDNLASRALLRKLGFVRAGTRGDDELWKLP